MSRFLVFALFLVVPSIWAGEKYTEHEVLEQIAKWGGSEADDVRKKLQTDMDTNISDLRYDELAHVELVLHLEEAFKFDITDDESKQLKTFRDFKDFTIGKLKEYGQFQ